MIFAPADLWEIAVGAIGYGSVMLVIDFVYGFIAGGW